MAFTRTVAPVLWPGSQKPTEGHRCKVAPESSTQWRAAVLKAHRPALTAGVFVEHAQAYLPLLRMSFARNYVMRSKAPWMVAPLKSLLSLSSGSCGRYSRLLSQGARGGCS